MKTAASAVLDYVLGRHWSGPVSRPVQPECTGCGMTDLNFVWAIIPTGKRKGQNPSVASIYRALAEHAKREAYPEAIEAAHADFAALQAGAVPEPRTGAAAVAMG
ncbi:hypothetical protein ACPCK9_26475 [Streptomyces koyangensis]|uniref:hypothetical protein n=1 Tax=Streptomyces koyangensis TaxID=188770 RepID=UPI003C2F3391